MNYALIEAGKVVNITVWDGDATAWQPPAGQQAVKVPEGLAVDIGTEYINDHFVVPEPQAPTFVVTVPPSVTMRQARLALLAAGRLADVDDSIASMPSPQREAAQIEWEYAATVDRDSVFLQSLSAALGLTDVELDQLFTQAAAL